MSKKILKITSVFLIIILISPMIIFATEGGQSATFADDPTVLIDGPTTDGTNELFKIGNAILGIIQVIAIGLSVIAAIILGIKYMYSAPEEKAEIKKKLIPFIIGGALVFGAVSLVRIIENVARSI